MKRVLCMNMSFDLNPRSSRGKFGAETVISRQALLSSFSINLVSTLSMNIFKAVGIIQIAVMAEVMNIRYSIFCSGLSGESFNLSRWQPGKTGIWFQEG